MRLIGILLLLLLLPQCERQSPQPPAPTTAPDVAPIQDQVKHVWTCADKTRVLLIAEDGTRHCVKF